MRAEPVSEPIGPPMVDWLTTSTDGSETSGSAGHSDGTPDSELWECGDETVWSASTASLFDDALQTNFLEGGVAWTTVPAAMNPARPTTPPVSEGLFADHHELSRLTPSADSVGSGDSGVGPLWAAVPSVDIGSLANVAGLFQHSARPVASPPATVDAAVDLVCSHSVGIHPLRPRATAQVVMESATALHNQPPLSGADAPAATARGALAPGTSGHSRKNRSTRIPSGEAAKCPYCAGAVIIDGVIAPEVECQTGKGRFARYRPRQSARKDNRLAAWYVKYGYSGPPYCKGCSESFNSHLLRQNAQAARASCSRANPCRPCTAILGNFSVEADKVYHQFDTRQTARKAEKSQLPCRVKREAGADDNLSDSLVDHKRPRKTAPKLIKTVAAVAIAFAGAAGLLSMHGSETSGTRDASQPAASPAELGWTCGDEFSALFTGTIEAQMEINCAGSDDQTEFSCGVDECHERGLVPSEQRICRCDGCVRLGRCVGWRLEGHAPLVEPVTYECPVTSGPAQAAGRLSHADDGTDSADVEQFSWLVPGMIACERCSQMCSAHVGCERFECGSDAPTDRHSSAHRGTRIPSAAADPNRPQACTLHSSFAWPQPIVGLSTADGSRVPEGVVWRVANGDVWQWVLNPSYRHTDVSLVQDADGLDANSTMVLDLQSLWRFDSAERQWRAVQSSLTQRPAPRSGAATWHDSTGSMFLFSGTGCGDGANLFSQYIPGTGPGTPLSTGCQGLAQFADLWRFDTSSLTWQKLYERRGTNGTTLIGRKMGWPTPREKATVWAQAHEHEQRFAAWMFGGAGFRLGYTRPDGMGATSELWQFTYAYAESLGDAATFDGKLKQSSAGAPNLVNDGQWVLVTIDLPEAHLPQRPDTSAKAVYECLREQECPGPRMDAGGWSDPNGRPGGWLFGGVAWAHAGRVSASGLPEDAPLFDLWHFNGDAGQPVWRSIARPALPATSGAKVFNWPPAWVGPTGWTTSVGGGEIWIVGQSGVQHDVYTSAQPVGVPGTPQGSLHEVVDGEGQSREDMWVFYITEGRWALISQPMDMHIETRAEGGQTVFDRPTAWPGPRQAAATGEGVMFGGIGSRECADVLGQMTQEPRASVGLTGMWTWVDSASNVHGIGGSGGGGKS